MKLRALSLALLASAGCTDPQVPSDPGPDATPLEIAPYTLRPDGGAGLWADGVVHYAFTTQFGGEAGAMAALDAAHDFYGQVSSVRFVLDQSLLHDFSKPGVVYSISTAPGPECTGVITTRRKLGTGDTTGNGGWAGSNIAVCATSDRDILIHETGHALGMAHEQSRPDRDRSVSCHPENMDTEHPQMCGTEGDPNDGPVGFGSATWAECMADPCHFAPPYRPIVGPVTVYGDYDVDSTMQYRGNYFRKAGTTLPTLTAKDPQHPTARCPPNLPDNESELGDCIAQPHNLSIGDVNTLLQLYQEPLQAVTSTAQFGAAIAVGDFDGDGFDDVAVGAPGTVWEGKATGAVFLYKGTAGRRQVTGNTMGPTDWLTNLVPWRVLRPSDFGKTGQDGEQFGASLKAGDLVGHAKIDNDTTGLLDLAIGAPGRDGGVGAIYVGYGHAYVQKSPTDPTARATAVFGLQTGGTTARPTFYAASAFLPSTSPGEQFGRAIAAGDFDADGLSELAVSTSSRVALLQHATPTTRAMTLAKTIVPGQIFASDFGRALATIDLDGDGRSDLVVGAPQSDAPHTAGAGSVFVFTSGKGFVDPAVTSGPSPVQGARFGLAVATGHYLAGGGAQIAVGAPGRGGAGRVFVFQWAGSTLSTVPPQQIGESIDRNQAGADGDQFGAALRTARIHGGKQDDLVVGAPGKNGVGAVFTLTADHTPGSTAFTDGAMHTPPPVAGTGFGGALSSGDLDADGNPDLIVGAIGEIPAQSPGGNITALHGSPDGITGQKLWRFPAFKSEQP